MKNKLFFLKDKLSVLGVFVILFLWTINAKAQLPTAQQVASQMTVGWNLGNSLESTGGETAWGGSVTNQALIDLVKASGFNTVRIPCAWDSHTTNGVIDPAWIARVKQVVDYCINDNLYVILNIHWDGGWLEKNITTAAQASVNAKQKNYWTQIANYFKSYNEHLIFASANEPDAPDATAMAVLLSYHQTFVNAVRSTGGNNATRSLIIQGPQTNIELSNSLMTMPTDSTPNRLMAEVHYYTPYQFCILGADGPNSWEKMYYYWGKDNHSTTDVARNANYAEEDYVESSLNLMKTKFIDKGIPVIMGEYAAIHRTLSNPTDQALHDASYRYFYKYVTGSMKAKGIIPVCWDINMGLYNRGTATVLDQPTIDAIMQGAGITQTKYFTLTNRSTGLLMDGMYRNDLGSNAGQWSNSVSSAQQWSIETIGNYVKIKNRATGLYIDGMGRTTNPSIAGQWASSTSNNQQWTQEASGTAGIYKFKNRATGLYLDGLGNNTNGADLGQWGSSSSYNQQWKITNVGSPQTAKMLMADNVEIEDSNIDFTFYPNPFVHDFKLDLSNHKGKFQINIINMLGQVLESLQTDNTSVPISLGASLKSGLYVVKVEGVNSKYSKSFKVLKK